MASAVNWRIVYEYNKKKKTTNIYVASSIDMFTIAKVSNRETQPNTHTNDERMGFGQMRQFLPMNGNHLEDRCPRVFTLTRYSRNGAYVSCTVCTLLET